MTSNDSKLRIVVGGYLGLLPAGGVVWDYLQYPLGFAELGHDVYYIEDTGLWPIFQESNEDQSAKRNVAHLRRVMESFDLADRWAYRDAVSGQSFGLSERQVQDVCKSADVFVNVSCASQAREEYERIPHRILIDSDPMFTQMRLEAPELFPAGNPKLREVVAGYTHLFSFGENIGQSDCLVPNCGFEWMPTRQPICLDHWPVQPIVSAASDPHGYSTVMNWSAERELKFAGKRWGQKNMEWNRLMKIPTQIDACEFTVAVTTTVNNDDGFPLQAAKDNGWRVLDPQKHVPDWDSYRQFIQHSQGELSVAKQTYVQSQSGWFSCRSACYLAAGRPVVTQDTGWSNNIPTGKGLFAFTEPNQAIDAVRAIESNPKRHSTAARELAVEYFDARQVLANLLAKIGA